MQVEHQWIYLSAVFVQKQQIDSDFKADNLGNSLSHEYTPSLSWVFVSKRLFLCIFSNACNSSI